MAHWWHSRTITAAALASSGLCSGCYSDHHVSPWPEDVDLDSLFETPDLKGNLARINDEMTREGMHVTLQVHGKLQEGGPLQALGYAGEDRLGRKRTATRVATPFSIVLALGPQGPSEASSAERTELARSLLGDSAAFASGTDLNGDGCPDVIAKGGDGTLEIWCIRAAGASKYAVAGVAAPSRALDVDGDGVPELAGIMRMQPKDALGLELWEVTSFVDGKYRFDTELVRGYHAVQLKVLDKAKAQWSSAPEQLAGALQIAWHSLRAGQNKDTSIAKADLVARALAPLGPGLAQSWVWWRGWLSDLH